MSTETQRQWTRTRDQGPGMGCREKGRDWEGKARKSWLTLRHHLRTEGLAWGLRPRNTPHCPPPSHPSFAGQGETPPGAGHMRTAPLCTPRGHRRHPPRATSQPDSARPRAASRRSRASELRSHRRHTLGPGHGHHLGPGLRAHTSRSLARAQDVETFLQVWAPPASSKLASV